MQGYQFHVRTVVRLWYFVTLRTASGFLVSVPAFAILRACLVPTVKASRHPRGFSCDRAGFLSAAGTLHSAWLRASGASCRPEAAPVPFFDPAYGMLMSYGSLQSARGARNRASHSGVLSSKLVFTLNKKIKDAASALVVVTS